MIRRNELPHVPAREERRVTTSVTYIAAALLALLAIALGGHLGVAIARANQGPMPLYSVNQIRAAVDDRAGATASLASVSGVKRVVNEEGGVRVEGKLLRPYGLFTALASAGIAVRAFREGRTLEEAYLGMVHNGDGGHRIQELPVW